MEAYPNNALFNTLLTFCCSKAFERVVSYSILSQYKIIIIKNLSQTIDII